jgi:archaellum component FlaG (FlaF/FlaG flagellin family)
MENNLVIYKRFKKPHTIVFFMKNNGSVQGVYKNRHLKLQFQGCCGSQNKTQKIRKTNSILNQWRRAMPLKLVLQLC